MEKIVRSGSGFARVVEMTTALSGNFLLKLVEQRCDQSGVYLVDEEGLKYRPEANKQEGENV